MNAYGIFQVIAVALILAWSAAFGLRRAFPRAGRAVQAALAARFARSSQQTLRAFGEKITPKQIASGAGCDSGGGCSSCGTCAPMASAPHSPQPLIFHPPSKHRRNA